MKAAIMCYLAIGLLTILFCSLPPQLSARENAGKLDKGELTQMLAPIALYPDTLLAKILMAATYPIEVIEADRWLGKYPGLTGTDLDMVLQGKDWEPSVKALCHFPSILSLMSEKIAQTTKLGDVFLSQEEDVMETIQELRIKAYARGSLANTSKHRVIVRKEIIIIEPADPRIIYVPYYDPFYIYGPWKYSAHPPFYWAPRGVRIGRMISYWPGYYSGYVFGAWSIFDWPGRYIHIDIRKRPRFVRHDQWDAKPGRWRHVPRHRRGVAYHDENDRHDDYPRKSSREYYEPRRSNPTQVPDRFMPMDQDRSRFQPPGFSRPPENSSPFDAQQQERKQRQRDGHDRQMHDGYDDRPDNNSPNSVPQGRIDDSSRKGGVKLKGKSGPDGGLKRTW